MERPGSTRLQQVAQAAGLELVPLPADDDGLVIEDDYLSQFSYDRPAPPVMKGTAKDRVALAQLMQSGAYDRHLRASRQRYRVRRNAMTAALARHLPGPTHRIPGC